MLLKMDWWMKEYFILEWRLCWGNARELYWPWTGRLDKGIDLNMKLMYPNPVHMQMNLRLSLDPAIGRTQLSLSMKHWPSSKSSTTSHLMRSHLMQSSMLHLFVLCTGDQATKTPSSNSYLGGDRGREYVNCFILSALNKMGLWTCNVTNAYPRVKAHERVYSIEGKEFGQHENCMVLIVVHSSVWHHVKWGSMALFPCWYITSTWICTVQAKATMMYGYACWLKFKGVTTMSD